MPLILKYWQVIMSMVLLTAGGATFYFGTVALGGEVLELKQDQKSFITRTELGLRLSLIDQKQASTEDKVEKNDTRTKETLEKIDDKLEKIQQLLLDNAAKSN